MYRRAFAKRDDLFPSFAGHPRLHQTRRSLGNDDLRMRRDMIAMRVRNEGQRFRIPWIEPEILFRQENPALISDVDHVKI